MTLSHTHTMNDMYMQRTQMLEMQIDQLSSRLAVYEPFISQGGGDAGPGGYVAGGLDEDDGDEDDGDDEDEGEDGDGMTMMMREMMMMMGMMMEMMEMMVMVMGMMVMMLTTTTLHPFSCIPFSLCIVDVLLYVALPIAYVLMSLFECTVFFMFI